MKLDEIHDRVMVEVGNWDIKDFFFYYNPSSLLKVSTRSILWHKGYTYCRHYSITDAIQCSQGKLSPFRYE